MPMESTPGEAEGVQIYFRESLEAAEKWSIGRGYYYY